MVDKLEYQRIRRRNEALKKLGFGSKYNKNSKEDMFKFIFTDDNGMWYKSERNFKSVFPDIYEDICSFVSDTDITFTSFCQKLYNYTLNDKEKRICSQCGKEISFDERNCEYKKYCSLDCWRLSGEIGEKISKTKTEIYSDPKKKEEIMLKNIKTCKEKYGGIGFASKVLSNKSYCTHIERYGVKYPAEVDGWIDLVKKTKLERYGDEWYSNVEKAKQTNLEKYGVEWTGMVEEFREKQKKKLYQNIKNKYNLIDIQNKDGVMIWTVPCTNRDCELCNEKCFDISSSLYFSRLPNNYELCTIKNPINHEHIISCGEIELYEFIQKIYDKEIIRNDRIVLNGKELDIYIPEIKLAIEYNGVYWHNETKNKSNNYHQDKFKECLKNGIQLIQIWEDDWLFKRDIVKNIILSKLGKNKKIYARKCDIKLVSNKDTKQFISEYHLQGYINSSINIGLYYNDELVEIATFGKNRKVTNIKSKYGEYELYRLCTKGGYTVVGGFGKILKYFEKHYNPLKLITYASLDISNGNVYKMFFNESVITKPGYYWVKGSKKYHRYNFTKQKLVKMGYDSNKTENEIMYELGYVKLYDSGNLKFTKIYDNLNQ